MTKDEALKLALEALKQTWTKAGSLQDKIEQDAIAAIKTALAQLEQEPVAWVEYETGNHTKRPWVGLTDEEIWGAVDRIGTSDSNVNPYQTIKDARAIEAKLKEKNT
jgi:alkylhydroperoxidase/carboxymuconolactone decarboxylase family protein YurZ